MFNHHILSPRTGSPPDSGPTPEPGAAGQGGQQSGPEPGPTTIHHGRRSVLGLGLAGLGATGLLTGLSTALSSPAEASIQPASLGATNVLASSATLSMLDFHNGGTDYTAAIQSAIDAANPGNGRFGGAIVSIPSGQYKVSGGIRVHAGVAVVGEGWGSQLLLADNSNRPVFEIVDTPGVDGTPSFASRISSLRIYGNYKKQSSDSPAVRVASGSATTPVFRDHIHHLNNLFLQYIAGDGIVVENTRCTRIDYVRVVKCTGAGVRLAQSSDSSLIRIESAGNGVGFIIDSSSNNIVACRASRNSADGFVISGSRNALVNGYSLDNNRDGYRVEGAQTNLTGCVADSNQECGLLVRNTKNLVASGLSSFSRQVPSSGSSPWHQQYGVRFVNSDRNYVTGMVAKNQTDIGGNNPNGVTQLVIG